MKFSVEWQDDARNVALEERATVADLRLWISQQNVTLHIVDGDTEDYLTMPLYSLAEGLAHEWWTLFGGRDRAISLITHRMGYAVPDVRLAFDGSAFEIASFQRTYDNPDVRFWAGSSEVLTRDEAEKTLDDFISSVVERLSNKEVHGTGTALRWKRVKDSRLDPDETSFCEAAGALGLDPYQVDDAAAAAIDRASRMFSAEPLAELLAGTRPARVMPVLDWVEAVERRPAYRSRVADLRNVAAEAAKSAPCNEAERGWALGYRRARATRKALALSSAHRFKSHKSLATLLGAGGQFSLAPRIDGIRALRHDDDDVTRIHLRDHGRAPFAQAAESFTFARAVGDVVCFPSPTRSPVNDLHDATRQAAGRAFAAELLAPVEEILSMWKDGHDIPAIADEFAVGEEVVYRQMENAPRIRAACA